MEDFAELAEKIPLIVNQNELFAIMQLLVNELNYEWINKEESWLTIAYQLEQYGETDLAKVFTVANQHAFQLSLKGR